MTLILFTTVAPDPLAEELSQQGHTVYEAIAISEVYALADQHPRAQIIITADIDPERAKAVSHRVNLPNGREDEFARWIYVDPRRCPGLRLNHEVYRQLMMNRDDQFEVGDFVDLNHLFAVPYVEAATLDNRMREYCSRAARRLVRVGLAVDYRDRLYRNLSEVMQGK